MYFDQECINPGLSSQTKSNKKAVKLNGMIGVQLGSDKIEQNQTSIIALRLIFQPVESVEQSQT